MISPAKAAGQPRVSAIERAGSTTPPRSVSDFARYFRASAYSSARRQVRTSRPCHRAQHDASSESQHACSGGISAGRSNAGMHRLPAVARGLARPVRRDGDLTASSPVPDRQPSDRREPPSRDTWPARGSIPGLRAPATGGWTAHQDGVARLLRRYLDNGDGRWPGVPRHFRGRTRPYAPRPSLRASWPGPGRGAACPPASRPAPRWSRRRHRCGIPARAAADPSAPRNEPAFPVGAPHRRWRDRTTWCAHLPIRRAAAPTRR